jgi:hypothetical protein
MLVHCQYIINTTYCSVEKIERNWLVGARSAYRGRRGLYSVLVVKPEEKGQLEIPSVYGRIILRRIF